ncbi:MAG: NAD(P)H-dependent oxidoreductase subunit E [Chloroflexi bacterium]|nr:NAD(P)H-dependent oxidoreductase subunit E [Chloroflexota bacterium]
MNQLLKKHGEQIEQILAKYPVEHRQAAIMPLLHLAQQEFGFVSRTSLQEISEITGTSTTEVASIVGFYTLFHDSIQGKIRLQVCTDVACDLRGAKEYLKDLCQQLGLQPGDTSKDSLITIEEVKCLAACDRAPLFQAQIGDELEYHENQTTSRTIDWLRSMSSALIGTPLMTLSSDPLADANSNSGGDHE